MADSKITALTAISTVDPAADPLVIVDVSDTSMAASGTTKKATINQLLGASGTATLASATITGALGAAGLNVTGSTIPANGVYLGSANNLSFSAASALGMTLNSSGLGVGASPSISGGGRRALTINSAAGQLSILELAVNGTMAGYLFSNASQTTLSSQGATFFSVETNNTERFRIDSSGNVGIGVTPSAWATLRGLQNGRANLVGYVSNSEGAWFTNNAFYDGSWKYQTSAQASHYQQLSGVHSWSIAATGTAGNAITFTQAMTLDASGNLLVGTTSAGGNRLNVQTASGDCLMLLKAQAANTNFVIDYVSNYGNYTIRKSGAAVWDYGVISDSSVTPAFKIQNASSVGVQLVSGATSWTTLSDETMKDIIEPISNAVAKVGSLRSVIGKFKTDDSGKRRSFLIAQDVQSVLPEAVDVIGENNELGLRYTEVIPLLVAAIKELTAEVNALKNA